MNKQSKAEETSQIEDEIFGEHLAKEEGLSKEKSLTKSKKMRAQGIPRIITQGTKENWQQYVYGGRRR